ncbi:hypothetical protein [Pseudomonas mohnii]
MLIGYLQVRACLAGWRDSLKWGICVRPGMEPDQGGIMLPVLLAILGAAAGAYFAIFKTKQEKLWLERYEKTSHALIRANLISRFLHSELNGEYETHGLTPPEKKSLDTNWPMARYELEQDIVLLQLLFTESDLKEVRSAWGELQIDLFYLIEESSGHDRPEYIAKALPKSEWLEGALIEIARRRCVENVFSHLLKTLKSSAQ